MVAFKAHFDGKVIVPDEPVDLTPNQRLIVHVETVEPEKPRGMTGAELAKSEIVGIWADRTDIGDSVEFARELRRRVERREI